MNTMTWDAIQENEGDAIQMISESEIDDVSGGWIITAIVIGVLLLWPKKAY